MRGLLLLSNITAHLGVVSLFFQQLLISALLFAAFCVAVWCCFVIVEQSHVGK